MTTSTPPPPHSPAPTTPGVPSATVPDSRQAAAADRRWLGLKPGHLIALLLIVLIGGGIWFYEEIYEERYVAERFGQVQGENHVFRSSQLPPAIVESVLRENKIDVVVDLTSAKPGDPKQEAELAACEKLGIERHRFPMGGDGVGTAASYTGAITAIHRAAEAGQRVLVHCQAGTQRTGGVLSAYRMLIRGTPAGEVYRESQIYDWEPDEDTAWPIFLNENMQQIAEGLVANHVIAAVPDPLPTFGP